MSDHRMNDQRRRRSIESSTLPPYLPPDLIVRILLRLPVRSLLCFKSVCKLWLSLISDPDFGKSHFDLAVAPTYRYMQKVNDSYELESLDINDESSVVKHKTPLDKYPDIIGSCRGFILLSYNRLNIFVWNPSTGFKRRIAQPGNIGSRRLDKLIGFGYDISADDYLIVLIYKITNLRDFVDIFSLRTNSWYCVEANAQYSYPLDHSRVGSFLKQTLHWLVKSSDTQIHVIIAFDLGESSLSEIPLSRELAMKLEDNHYHLRVLGECLSLCHQGGAGRVGRAGSKAEIWIMKEYKVQSSWTMLFVFSTSNIPRNVFIPISFPKHDQIFGSNGCSRRLMMLNHAGRLFDQFTTCDEPGGYHYEYDQEDCDIYIESLLSLPDDFLANDDLEEVNEDYLEEASDEDYLEEASEDYSEEASDEDYLEEASDEDYLEEASEDDD